MLGLAGELARSEAGQTESPYISEPLLVTVMEGTTVVMAALQTPPYKLILSGGTEAAIMALVEWIVDQELSLPGVNGPAKTAQTLAERWARRTGQPTRQGLSLGVHRLTRVIEPPRPPGVFRQAEHADVSTLAEWGDAFSVETGVDDPRPGIAIVELRMASGGLYVWDDGGPVSMASWTGATPSGVRVSFVYTPPESRGHGYASACVAALSGLLLDRGNTFCALFTDLANPISNRIYRRIGYEPVCDFTEYRFS